MTGAANRGLSFAPGGWATLALTGNLVPLARGPAVASLADLSSSVRAVSTHGAGG